MCHGSDVRVARRRVDGARPDRKAARYSTRRGRKLFNKLRLARAVRAARVAEVVEQLEGVVLGGDEQVRRLDVRQAVLRKEALPALG